MRDNVGKKREAAVAGSTTGGLALGLNLVLERCGVHLSAEEAIVLAGCIAACVHGLPRWVRQMRGSLR